MLPHIKHTKQQHVAKYIHLTIGYCSRSKHTIILVMEKLSSFCFEWLSCFSPSESKQGDPQVALDCCYFKIFFNVKIWFNFKNRQLNATDPLITLYFELILIHQQRLPGWWQEIPTSWYLPFLKIYSLSYIKIYVLNI